MLEAAGRLPGVGVVAGVLRKSAVPRLANMGGRGALAGMARYGKWWALAFLFNVLIAVPFLLSTASGTRAAWYSFPLDDTWIHLDYVRSFATQGCLCYNDGVWEAGSTSWAWVLFLTPFYLLFHMGLGLDLVLLVKFIGLALGGLITVFAYVLVLRVTGSRRVAVVGAVVAALEPTFAYHRISGMEGTLIVAAVLGTTLAIVSRRWLLAGLGLAAALWTRPELALFLAVAFPVVLRVWYMSQGGVTVRALRQVAAAPFVDSPREALAEAVPRLRRVFRGGGVFLTFLLPLIAVVMWLGYNKLINGTWYPNAYLVKHDWSLPLLPLGNIYNLFRGGMVHWQPWLQGWVLPVTVVVYGFGAWYAVRRGGIALLPLVLLPLLLLLAVAKGLRFDDPILIFWTRRYVDPTAPIILLVLVIGVWGILTQFRRWVVDRTPLLPARAARLGPLFLVVLVAVVLSLVRDVPVWAQIVEDYSWNTRNIDDVDVAAGKWLAENTPEDATVFVFDAGAIRYFGQRYTYDVVGLNTKELIGRDHLDVALTEKPDYLVMWRIPVYEQLPNATTLSKFDTPLNTILGYGPVSVYEMDWNPETFASAERFYGVQPEGRVIDTLHMTDAESESGHDYFITWVGYAPRAAGSIGGVGIVDRGIAHGGSLERFTMAAVPGKALTLVLRYRATEVGDAADVRVDGAPAGTWALHVEDIQFQEAVFTVPAELITRDRVEIEIQWKMGMTEFRWWAVVDDEEPLEMGP